MAFDSDRLVLYGAAGSVAETWALKNGIPFVAEGEQAPDSIELEQTSLVLGIGENAKLDASLTPENAANVGIYWYSDDETIATVTSEGLVCGKGVGTTTIYALTGTGLSAACDVTVDEVAVSSLWINAASETVYIGDTLKMWVFVEPAHAMDQTIVWASSMESVAMVDENGLVTPIAPGETIITATAGNENDISAGYRVTVKQHPESIVLSAENVLLKVGNTCMLTVDVFPEEAENDVIWTTNNPTVADVENGTVVCNAPGQAIIRACTENGLTATCEITVVDRLPEEEEIRMLPADACVFADSPLQLTLLDDSTGEEIDSADCVWQCDIGEITSAGELIATQTGMATVSATMPDGTTVTRTYPCIAQDGIMRLPAATVQIGDDAFRGNSAMTCVLLPGRVEEICQYAFADCDALNIVYIPESVNAIADSAFDECPNLTILCLQDGYAEEYAVDQGIRCYPLSDVSSFED